MQLVGGSGAGRNPAVAHIPDSRTAGVRSYREPEQPHPLQLAFLTEEGERAYVERLRELLTQGRADEADAILAADLAGFDGSLARIAQVTTANNVTIEGWDDLLPILDEFEGPPITAIAVGLTNELDLVFEGGQPTEPALLLGLYSDDVFAFSEASREQLLAECASDAPAWGGHEEDVEFYAELSGLAELNSALIHCKHRHFLRDGRDGVTGRAPGGYVEYVLGSWLRATRFLQALNRAVADHGLPAGARIIGGSVGLQTDFATVLEPAKAKTCDKVAAAAPAPVATLTIKPWVPREDPLADLPASGATLRQRLAPAAVVAVAAELPVPAPAPADVPAPRRGFLARLFGRR
jgi:hypothetical protein